MRIRKFKLLYYQVTRVDGGYGYKIYNSYKKNRETLEENDDVFDSVLEAENAAEEAITCHYD